MAWPLLLDAAILLAIAGIAALLKWHLGAGLILAGTVTLIVTVLGTIHARHHPGPVT